MKFTLSAGNWPEEWQSTGRGDCARASHFRFRFLLPFSNSDVNFLFALFSLEGGRPVVYLRLSASSDWCFLSRDLDHLTHLTFVQLFHRSQSSTAESQQGSWIGQLHVTRGPDMEEFFDGQIAAPGCLSTPNIWKKNRITRENFQLQLSTTQRKIRSFLPKIWAWHLRILKV